MSVPERSDPEIRDLLGSEYSIDASISRLAGENENYLVVAPAGVRYVLKIVPGHVGEGLSELENAATEAIAESDGLELALPRFVPTLRGGIEARHVMSGGRVVRARLLAFVSGTQWCEAGPPAPERLTDVGRCIARVANALAWVDVPAARRTHHWNLAAAGQHRAKTGLIDDPSRRRIVDEAFTLWCAEAEPGLSTLPHSLIHGDLNDENVLLSGERVSGLLDFGDALFNPTVCDLGIALAYLMLDEPDPLAAGAKIVAAYHEVRPLMPAEIEVLFPLVCGRLAVSVVTSAERRLVDPGRIAWFVTEERAWRALERYAAIDPVEAAEAFASLTGVPVCVDRGAPREELRRRRRTRISSALSLTYDDPVKFIRGRGQYLVDEKGRPYLDLYNNVCHVGHCHPHVVAAGQKQLARLNTNTRYLYDGLTDYAERLCATLPPTLEVCFFVNSGSEANELALRLARAHTGAEDVIVVDHAYHGHTTTLIDISPYKFMGKGGEGRPKPWVHIAPIPDGYRGKYLGPEREAGIAYGDDVGDVIAGLERAPACFIAESLMSVGGQIIPPPGYFETAFRHVRDAGGVCILDEVQVGFGRTGEAFWAFELQDVAPDIVVMGKPIGNGHPMGAVVTTRAIAESFEKKGMEFFSTFGGNPVSCAIGSAVLDVIEEEKLQDNALHVGTFLRDGLRDLMSRHALIGDVRGAGLFIGIELVTDRDTREPATEDAARLVNALQRRRILTGTDGPHENVVKIKGPMVVTEDDAEMAIAAVDEVLGQL
jgi:4-aminobutyrate aminotransferase-like enzyme/Ser/Thr protein kinase RdoA (MazF antagonist)